MRKASAIEDDMSVRTKSYFNQTHISVTHQHKSRSEEFLKENRRYHHIFNRWRLLDVLTTVLAVCGLVFSIANYEIVLGRHPPTALNFNTRLQKRDLELKMQAEFAMENVRFTDPIGRKIKWCVFIMSLSSTITMVMRHYFKVVWLKKYFNSNKHQ